MKIWKLDENSDRQIEESLAVEIKWEESDETDPIQILLANFDWSPVLAL